MRRKSWAKATCFCMYSYMYKVCSMSEREDWDRTPKVLGLRKIRRHQSNGTRIMVPLSSSIWRNLLIKALTNILLIVGSRMRFSLAVYRL
jgi:hypothetical protein